jgi:ssDNA-binding Zn-finger/Zn-ribbon topoisomerase 1
MVSLKKLFESHTGYGTDKWEFYLTEYERIFSPYRNQPVTMLEIGIQNGGSLEIWSKFFSNGKKFVGCDINPDCNKIAYQDKRISLVIGDANTDETEERLVGLSQDGFDIIIDDGSHTSNDIVQSFCRYFKYLNYGGVFIIEDLHCSYWQSFEGGLFYPFSSIAFFKSIVDVINHEHWGIDRSRSQLLSGICSHFSICLSEELLAEIHSIEFSNSLCVIRKKKQAFNQLGPRMLSGKLTLVVEEHPELVYMKDMAVSEIDNYWATLDDALDVSFEDLVNQIRSLESQLLERDAQLVERDAQLVERDAQLVERDALLDKILSSISWKLTMPLRFLKKKLFFCKKD